MDEQDQSQSEELVEGEATVLPAREAISLITQDTSGQEAASSAEQSTQTSTQDSA